MPSAIEWTDETWNPVTGCTRVSPGCDHCYMFALYPRLKAMAVPGYEAAPNEIRLLPERLRTPLSWKKPRRVFVNSMSDVFHPRVPFDFIYQMFSVMDEAAHKRGSRFPNTDQATGKSRWLVGAVQTALPARLATQHLDRDIRGKPEIRA